MQLPFKIECHRPFLIATFPQPNSMLSWAIIRPGYQTASRVVWMEVQNKDLPEHLDATQLIETRLEAADLSNAVGLITSRDICQHHIAQTTIEDVVATCLTTIGLSNGERVGMRSTTPVPLPGTINTLVHVSLPLTQSALLETMSVITQARTTAIIDSGVRRDGVAITGTGTDCVVVAAPIGETSHRYAGLHTAIGEAVGNCTYRAIADGIQTWMIDFKALQTSALIGRQAKPDGTA